MTLPLNAQSSIEVDLAAYFIGLATAAAAVRTPCAYCFGCDQNHPGKDCALVQATVATNPEYKAVLFAKRPDPLKLGLVSKLCCLSPKDSP